VIHVSYRRPRPRGSNVAMRLLGRIARSHYTPHQALHEGRLPVSSEVLISRDVSIAFRSTRDGWQAVARLCQRRPRLSFSQGRPVPTPYHGLSGTRWSLCVYRFTDCSLSAIPDHSSGAEYDFAGRELAFLIRPPTFCKRFRNIARVGDQENGPILSSIVCCTAMYSVLSRWL
jgi:hypothetical protein